VLCVAAREGALQKCLKTGSARDGASLITHERDGAYRREEWQL